MPGSLVYTVPGTGDSSREDAEGPTSWKELFFNDREQRDKLYAEYSGLEASFSAYKRRLSDFEEDSSASCKKLGTFLEEEGAKVRLRT